MLEHVKPRFKLVVTEDGTVARVPVEEPQPPTGQQQQQFSDGDRVLCRHRGRWEVGTYRICEGDPWVFLDSRKFIKWPLPADLQRLPF